MASLRATCLLGSRASKSAVRPLRQLERQFGLLQLATPVSSVHRCSTGGCMNNTQPSRSFSQTQRALTTTDDFDDFDEDALLDPNAAYSPEQFQAFFDAQEAVKKKNKNLKGAEETEAAAESEIPPSMALPGYARPVPATPSYFSPQPDFVDTYLKLQRVFRQYGNLPLAPADEVKRMAWLSLLDYRQATGEKVKTAEYNKCLAIVKHLHKIHPSLKPPIVENIVNDFVRSINPFDNVPKPTKIDRFGRAIGVGSRKTSTARAWVVEGTGEVIVNGKSLSDAFARVHDRESATWALRATERADKYNIWALVEGGGTTGQAEAITMAVAKGLIAHEPALKTALRKAGCITRDPRMVERKKHGHLKARKSPAWVRR